jgi:isopenicillin N synthase-like dioxygenase
MRLEFVNFNEASLGSNAGELHAAFEKNGCCILHLTTETMETVANAIAASSRFFVQPKETKVAFSDNDTRVGFRLAGIEYSRSPERPDLMESLSYSHKYDRIIQELARNEIEIIWREASIAAFGALDKIFTNLLNALRSYVCPDLRQIYKPFPQSFSADGSFLQINHYFAELMSRSILQDSHEDGNLITLLLSDTDGLQLSLDEHDYIDCTPPSGCLLAFSGSLMTRLSEGRYPTVFHRVVRYPHIKERRSLMYFANPAPDQPLFPWGAGNDEDIARLAAESAERFGLPRLT